MLLCSLAPIESNPHVFAYAILGRKRHSFTVPLLFLTRVCKSVFEICVFSAAAMLCIHPLKAEFQLVFIFEKMTYSERAQRSEPNGIGEVHDSTDFY